MNIFSILLIGSQILSTGHQVRIMDVIDFACRTARSSKYDSFCAVLDVRQRELIVTAAMKQP
jgi:hypothetical protein